MHPHGLIMLIDTIDDGKSVINIWWANTRESKVALWLLQCGNIPTSSEEWSLNSGILAARLLEAQSSCSRSFRNDEFNIVWLWTDGQCLRVCRLVSCKQNVDDANAPWQIAIRGTRSYMATNTCISGLKYAKVIQSYPRISRLHVHPYLIQWGGLSKLIVQ